MTGQYISQLKESVGCVGKERMGQWGVLGNIQYCKHPKYWDRSEQTGQTQIRLHLNPIALRMAKTPQSWPKLHRFLAVLSAIGLNEQSDQGIHCLPFHLYVLDKLLY